jgi:hypothetical protein
MPNRTASATPDAPRVMTHWTMRSRGISKRFWVPWCLVGSLMVLTGAAGIVGTNDISSKSSPSSPPAAFGPPTGFGGYRSSGSADEISAEWRVPAVLDSSRIAYGWMARRDFHSGQISNGYCMYIARRTRVVPLERPRVGLTDRNGMPRYPEISDARCRPLST